MRAICNKAKRGALVFVPGAARTCSDSIHYEGKLGCPTASLDVEKYAEMIGSYIGVIVLCIGLVMTFFGSRFIQLLGAVVIGLVICAITFMVGYNFLPHNIHSPWALIGILVVGIILGGLAGWVGWNFIKNWVVSIFAAACGVVGMMLLLGIADVTNLWVRIACIIIGIVIGGFVGKSFNRYIKTLGTAFIGSFLTVRGASFFLGGWPGEDIRNMSHKYDTAIFAYLGAFIVLFFAGGLV